MSERYWVGQCPWIAADELADVMDRNVSTINRRLLAQHGDEIVDYIEVGRGGRGERRWLLTSEGVRTEYPVPGRGHRHPGPDLHTHDPLDPDPDPDCHLHPPWPVTKDGAGALYKRLEAVQALYSVFPKLFRGEGETWHRGEEAPRPVAWRWLKSGQLVDAVGTYRDSETEYRIGFCWVGRQLGEKALLDKWNNRFSDRRLVWVSEAEELYRGWDKYINPPDPDYDGTPQLDGYVFVCGDFFALCQAYVAIPSTYYVRPPAYLWVDVETGMRVSEGVVTSSMDDVADRFSDRTVGTPEHLCPDRRPEGEPGPPRPPLPVFMTRAAPLSNVLGFRILTLLAEWSGLTKPQVQRLCRESWVRVDDMLKAMLACDLIQFRENMNNEYMYYLGHGGDTYVANLDGIHVNTVRGRIGTDIKQDHRQKSPHWQHTLGRNETMIEMKEAGLAVYGGWRKLHNIPGVTQIPPDAVLTAQINGRTSLVFVEYERSARNPSHVEEKLRPYVKAARDGQPIQVAFVCETDMAADNFRAEARSVYVHEGVLVPAMVTTLKEVKKGPLTGPDAIWNLFGTPVDMR